MDQPAITLISFGYFEEEFLEQLAEAVRDEFPYPVRSREAYLDLSEYFDAGRRQYHGHKLLEALKNMDQHDSFKVIGLFNVDLFIPILTFIFGQAQLGGRAGITSLYRLNNERYGMPGNANLLLERFKKEVIHELGHTFGLIHCNQPVCVMKSSTYVEDIDQKELHLCLDCHDRIIHHIDT